MARSPDADALARLEELLDRMAEVRRALAGQELTVRQFRALRELGAGQLRIGRLAERIEIRGPSCVSLVDALTVAGLVERTRDPGDARASLVGLTGLGRRRLKAATAAAAAALSPAARSGGSGSR